MMPTFLDPRHHFRIAGLPYAAVNADTKEI